MATLSFAVSVFPNPPKPPKPPPPPLASFSFISISFLKAKRVSRVYSSFLYKSIQSIINQCYTDIIIMAKMEIKIRICIIKLNYINPYFSQYCYTCPGISINKQTVY